RREQRRRAGPDRRTQEKQAGEQAQAETRQQRETCSGFRRQYGISHKNQAKHQSQRFKDVGEETRSSPQPCGYTLDSPKYRNDAWKPEAPHQGLVKSGTEGGDCKANQHKQDELLE